MIIIGGTVRPESNSTGGMDSGINKTIRPNIWRANMFGFLEKMQVNLFIYIQ